MILVSLTTKVFLFVTLVLNVPSPTGSPTHSHPISHQMEVASIGECWAMAQELTWRAESGPLRTSGGFFTASCQVQVDPAIEH